MMATCRHCGKSLDDAARFCSYCGEPSEETGSSQSIHLLNRLKNLPDPSGLTKGTLVDERYEILSRESDSLFFTVFRVVDRQDMKTKRIKIIPPLLYDQPEAMDFLIQEFKSKLWLDSPNIIQIYSIQTEGAFKYVVTEYIKGRSLRELKYAAPQHRLPEKIVIGIAVQIAAALEYAHHYNVICGSLQPDSVIVNKQGHVKLDDFGMREALYNMLNLHLNVSNIRSLAYMSPEQLTGKISSIGTDIYAFGGLLYELLTGHPPFFSGDIRHQILNLPVPDMESVSPKLNLLIQKCLAKDPGKRYNQFAELREQLNDIQASHVLREEKESAGPVEKQPRQSAISMATGARFNWDLVVRRFRELPRRYYYGLAGLLVIIAAILILTRSPDRTSGVREQLEFIRQDFQRRALDEISMGHFFAAESILLNGLSHYPADSALISLTGRNLKLKRRYMTEEALSIEILNGAGVSGIAQNLADFLTEKDFRVVLTENYRENGGVRWDVPETFIINRYGYNIRVERIADLLGITRTEIDTSAATADHPDVTIVLGLDYENLAAFR